MLLTPYRETLALPKIRSLLVVATLARIPIAAAAVVLTLHVVTDLGRGYGAAGLVGAAATIGGSVGAPVMGRLIDRRGLRPVLVLTTVAEVIYWVVAQSLPYWALLPVAVVGGFLALPAFSVARQSIAALTPESHRLPAFALDSITTEMSFMAGPALGVLIATSAGPRVAMLTLAGGIFLSGLGLWLLNPPTRAAHEAPISSGERVPRRSWLKPRFVAILAVTMAATLVLAGTDVAVVAILRESGELSWTGLVLSLWAFCSLIGGFAYGMIRRGLPALVLFAPMALLTIPVGLGGHHWWLLALLLIPAGALCAPTITASSDAISRMIPAAARGEAMGLHNSALTVGVALGGPLAGLAIDLYGAAWGFVAVGAVGTLVALAVLPAELRRRRDPTPDPIADPQPAPVPSAPVAPPGVATTGGATSTALADDTLPAAASAGAASAGAASAGSASAGTPIGSVGATVVSAGVVTSAAAVSAGSVSTGAASTGAASTDAASTDARAASAGAAVVSAGVVTRAAAVSAGSVSTDAASAGARAPSAGARAASAGARAASAGARAASAGVAGVSAGAATSAAAASAGAVVGGDGAPAGMISADDVVPAAAVPASASAIPAAAAASAVSAVSAAHAASAVPTTPSSAGRPSTASRANTGGAVPAADQVNPAVTRG